VAGGAAVRAATRRSGVFPACRVYPLGTATAAARTFPACRAYTRDNGHGRRRVFPACRVYPLGTRAKITVRGCGRAVALNNLPADGDHQARGASPAARPAREPHPPRSARSLSAVRNGSRT